MRNGLRQWWQRVRAERPAPPDDDRAIREEIHFHIDMRAAEYMRAGMSREQARQAAAERFGDAGRVWLECREADGIADERIVALRKGDGLMRTLLWDIRYAFRMMRKAPSFTAVVIITLALGIGANTAIFSVIRGVLLRPLPWPDADRLVRVWESNPARGFPFFSVAPPNFADWRAQSTSFDYLCNYRNSSFTLTGNGEPERLTGARVSHDFFAMLGVPPVAGRFFRPEEDADGQGFVAVISEGLWQRRFNGDPNVVGRAVTLDGSAFTIIGVAPAVVTIPNKRTEIWAPAAFNAQTLTQARGAHYIAVIGRLKPNVSLAQAEGEMKGVAARLEKQYPASNTGWTARMLTVYETTVGDIRTSLLTLFGAVSFVLLIACANVANLMLVRASARQREIAIQAALGAGRGRVVRQLLTESVLLALTGSAAGLALANWGVRALQQIGPRVGIPRAWEITLDPGVLLFTLGLALATGILFGIFPVVQMFRQDVYEALKDGGRTSTGQARQRMRNSLVVAEVALSLMLLVGAGLFIRSIGMLRGVELGMKTDGLLTMQVLLPRAAYPGNPDYVRFSQSALEHLKAIPGVESVAGASNLPLSGDNESYSFGVAGAPDSSNAPSVDYAVVTQDFFSTAGIQLLSGRTFGPQDVETAQRVVVINRAMAQRFYPGQNPLGKQIQIGRNYSVVREIIGVVGDIRNNSIGEAPGNQAYELFQQAPDDGLNFLVRTSLDPESLSAAARTAIWAVDKNLVVGRMASMNRVVNSNFAQPMFRTVLLSVFSLIAVVLAAVGLYGVMSYAVERRTHEIGVRMALGAGQRDILKLILWHGLLLASLGVALGAVGAFWLVETLRTLLYEVKPRDPVAFATAAALLIAIALLACWVPARRAARVDPLVALRYE